MENLYWLFPVSGVKTYIFIPPLVAFVVSFFTSMGGVSGAFLLLPFQVSFLNFTSPSVSATNFVYNIVAIPSGVYRYLKEGRMAWPLTWVVIVGTLPGVFIGYYIRILYLPNPKAFKLFVGCVLLYLGLRLLYEMTSRSQKGKKQMKALEDKFNQHAKELKANRQAHYGLRVCRPRPWLKPFGFLYPGWNTNFGGNAFPSAHRPCFYWPLSSGLSAALTA